MVVYFFITSNIPIIRSKSSLELKGIVILPFPVFEYLNSLNFNNIHENEYPNKISNKILCLTSTTTSLDVALRYSLFCLDNIQIVLLKKGTKVFPVFDSNLSELLIAQSGNLIQKDKIWEFIPDKINSFNYDYESYIYCVHGLNKITLLSNTLKWNELDSIAETSPITIFNKYLEDSKDIYK